MKPNIRDLYFKVLDFEDEQLYELVLKNWIIENGYKNYLSDISNKLQTDKIHLSQEDIWELYALTCVLDILTLRFQPDNKADGSEWSGSKLSISEYVEFNNLIGLNTITPTSFGTFDCEILEAHTGENDFQINECLFPAVKLKNLMLKRAGVKISLNPQNYNLSLINNASIYWTFRRKNRKYFDLSQGWGSDSQWRTDLRLDIETDNSFIYNYNGKLNLNNITAEQLHEIKEQGLEVEEAIELTKYRHFISSTKNGLDLFPYHFKYEEKKNHA
ncbi:MAG: hypothetical protein KF900_01380 [Bacteroidetes bacterium]|nr:hypothetical protein [Bacteroidota bacterium]